MPPPAKRENMLVNLAFNIAIPSLILAKASTPERLGPVWGLIIALAFPISYGVWDFVQRRQANFVSILGFASVMLTGGLGLMKVGNFWFAVKEAAVPALIGIAVWLSTYTQRPLVRQFLFSDQVMDVNKIEAALDERANRSAFDQLLSSSTYLLVVSFVVSAVLNFVLARWLLTSPTGSPEFNAELGKMNALSWPVIVVPTMIITVFALWRLVSGITKLTGLKFEEMLHAEHVKQS
ncbi:VC0807 family protein [Synoicihabitans lomoniglobus]|uniref:MFS transporter n=1 Tax=Synoicihabitans lomoniglobus TaxID=2909285 RepID=A0AAE9ZWW9_9BACT|nr:MFS transporter [Opitutaceae bacterium LMO-M01]WED65652.1 MFS transporter [Opitutaceae bacterium LMO-M01]